MQFQDLECLLSNEGFCVYGPKGSDYTKVIPASVIKSFRELKLDELLVNNILVVWSGKSVFYSSYDDKIISLPFYDPIDTKAFSRFKSDLEKCADILVTLGDKK